MISRLASMEVESRDGVVLARVSGELDLSNVVELESALTDHIQNESRGLLLDMSGVRYLDSAGIQVLYELNRQLRSRGQALRLVVPADAPIVRTLEIVDAGRVVGVSDTVQGALSELAEPDS